MAVGICPWGRRFLLDSYVGRPGPTELLYMLMNMATKWGIRRIAIEEVTFSAVYAPLWATIINYEYDWVRRTLSGLTKSNNPHPLIPSHHRPK